jgi:hypothetical protein
MRIHHGFSFFFRAIFMVSNETNYERIYMEDPRELDRVQRAYIRIAGHIDRHRGKYSALATAVVIGGPAYYELRMKNRVIDALGGNEPAGSFVNLPLPTEH